MRNECSLLLILACGMVVTSAFGAVFESNQCPPRIVTQQTAVGDPFDGWKTVEVRGSHPLSGVSFSHGIPEKKVVLAPSKESMAGKSAAAEWLLPESDEEYWVSCEYARTTVVLARSIGSNSQRCVAEYDKRFSGQVLKKWSCDAGIRQGGDQ